MPQEDTKDVSPTLKLLVFQMHEAGYSQAQIAAYVNKATATINAMLKPLQRKKGQRDG
jgi:hypothetical protein